MYDIKNYKKIVGINVPESYRGSVDNLRQMPTWIIENARKLNNPRYAKYFMQYFVTDENWKYIPGFIEDVIDENEDPKKWLTQIYLVPDTSLADQLTREPISLFSKNIGKFKYLHPIRIQQWQVSASKVGCPVQVCDNVHYYYKYPKGMTSFSMDTILLPILENQSLYIIFRRWIATRIARMFYHKPEFLTFKDPEILEKYAPVATWTNDALIAFHGLVREREEIGWAEDQVPGFIGPDEFYT